MLYKHFHMGNMNMGLHSLFIFHLKTLLENGEICSYTSLNLLFPQNHFFFSFFKIYCRVFAMTSKTFNINDH